VAVFCGSGVSVGSARIVGVKTAAVNVNWETTVLAADVRTAATSGVGSPGEDQGNEDDGKNGFCIHGASNPGFFHFATVK
jgi:hypothetical protein